MKKYIQTSTAPRRLKLPLKKPRLLSMLPSIWDTNYSLLKRGENATTH